MWEFRRSSKEDTVGEINARPAYLPKWPSGWLRLRLLAQHPTVGYGCRPLTISPRSVRMRIRSRLSGTGRSKPDP